MVNYLIDVMLYAWLTTLLTSCYIHG